MTDSKTLAGALLAQMGEHTEAVDLLWRHADDKVLQATTSPSAELATQLALDGSAEVAVKVAEVTNDENVLNTLARKDTRKTVRQAVASNVHTNADTLDYLLGWALKPNVNHEGVFNSVLEQKKNSWECIFNHIKKVHGVIPEPRNNYGAGPWYRILELVTNEGAAAVEAARSENWPGLEAALTKSYLQKVRSADAIKLTLLTKGKDIQAKAVLLRSLLDQMYGQMNEEVAELYVEVLSHPEVNETYTKIHSGSKRELSEDAIKVLEGNASSSTGVVTDRLLAGTSKLDQGVRARLLHRHPELAGQVSQQMNLTTEEKLHLADICGDEEPPPTLVPYGNRVINPLMVFAMGNVPLEKELADRVLRYMTLPGVHGTPAKVLGNTQAGDRALRLEYIRTKGDWKTTQAWFDNKTHGPSVEEVLFILDDPGNALAESVSNPTGYGTTVVRTPLNLADFVSRNKTTFLHEKPWALDVIRSLRGVLPSNLGTDDRSLKILKEEMGELWGTAGGTDLLLSFGPTWQGTIPELAQIIRATLA